MLLEAQKQTKRRGKPLLFNICRERAKKGLIFWVQKWVQKEKIWCEIRYYFENEL
jgi:hypothetical protein